MRNRLLVMAGLILLAGCSFEIPGFLGRQGSGQGTYTVGGGPDTPEPVPVPLQTAEAERALHGVIVRAQGVAPTQGYYSASLRPVNGGAPDAAGIVGFVLTAVPPGGPENVGPERTRLLPAAVFLPNLALKSVRGVRVTGGQNVRTLPLR